MNRELVLEEVLRILTAIVFLAELLRTGVEFARNRKPGKIAKLSRWGVLIVFSAYMFVLGFNRGRCPFGSVAEALLFSSWIMLIAFTLSESLNRERSLAIFVFPLISALTFLGLLLIHRGSGIPEAFEGTAFPLHVSLALIADAAYLISVLMILIHARMLSNMKRKHAGFLTHRLPPLKVIERHASVALLAGNILLPMGLAIGIFWTHHIDNPRNDLMLKSGLSFFAWAAFLALSNHRRSKGPATRRGITLALTGLLFVVLTFSVGRHGW